MSFKAMPVILSVMCQHTDTAILIYSVDASVICPRISTQSQCYYFEIYKTFP